MYAGRTAKWNKQMQGKPKREVNWHYEFQGETNVLAGRASRDQNRQGEVGDWLSSIPNTAHSLIDCVGGMSSR